MHELSLAREMVRIIEAQSVSRDFTQVRRIHLRIGPFSCASAEALRFAFESLRRPLLEKAELCIEIDAVKGQCSNCGHIQRMDQRLQPCEKCGEDVHAGEGGDELRIIDLEVC